MGIKSPLAWACTVVGATGLYGYFQEEYPEEAYALGPLRGRTVIRFGKVLTGTLLAFGLYKLFQKR